MVDPDFMEDIAPDQRREMEPWLKRILDTEQYADHPLNRGWLSKLREGIGSLFGRERER